MNARQPAEVAQRPMSVKGFDRLLTTQRPVVLGHIRSIRKRHPDASPARIIQILERRYLAAVTTGGASVGAAAVIPGVGTGISLVLTGVETAGFLETSALFAQSVTEIHGIAVTDPDRARTIVMAMMLGTSGADLVRNLAAQATGKGVPQSKFWGDVIGRNVPQAFMGQIADRMQKAFIGRFTRNTATGAVGRLLPFGIGAVVGGTANNMLGRKVVNSSRVAFGPAPETFLPNLEPRVKVPKPIVASSVSGPAILRPMKQLGQLLPGRKSGQSRQESDAVAQENAKPEPQSSDVDGSSSSSPSPSNGSDSLTRRSPA